MKPHRNEVADAHRSGHGEVATRLASEAQGYRRMTQGG